MPEPLWQIALAERQADALRAADAARAAELARPRACRHCGASLAGRRRQTLTCNSSCRWHTRPGGISHGA